MGREGFGQLPATAFASYATELESGAWATVKVARSHGPDAPALGWLKHDMVESVAAVVAAQGHTSNLDALDEDWDDAQRRLVFAVSERTVRRDTTHRAAARRVQAALCPDGTTGMTNLDYDAEVDFGRNQVRVAKNEQLANDVQLLELGEYLRDIGAATEALATALGRNGGPAHQARSRRILQATRGCAATFNFVYEGLGRLLAHASGGETRATLEALRHSLDEMLARTTPAIASAPSAPSAAQPAATGTKTAQS